MGTTGGLDFSFDRRVVSDYDSLRGHPPEVAREIGQAIAAQMPSSARVLELGVGTGRIAVPVAQAGCQVVGMDVSAEMLGELAARIRQHTLDDIELVQADITAPPFIDRGFDGAMAVHVLHLVSSWAEVLDQVRRMVRPGGVLVLGRDWVDPESFSGRIRTAFRKTVVEVGTEMLPPGASAAAAPSGGAAIVKTLVQQGAVPTGEGELVAAEWTTELSPRQVLDGIRSRDDAESWVLPDDVLTETMQRLDALAQQEWPDLDQPLPVLRRFMLGCFRYEV